MDETFLSGLRILIVNFLPFCFLLHNKVFIQAENQFACFSKAGEAETEDVASGIYDANGRKVKITFGKDKSLNFSSNSTAEIIALANGMAKTEIGFNTLKLMDASDSKITIEVDTVNTIPRSDGKISAAETYPIISTPVNSYGTPIGRVYISKAKIIIYQATIKDVIARNHGKILINGVMIDTKKFSLLDILSSYLIHEFIHVLDARSSSALNPMAARVEVERRPYEIQLQYFNELDEQNRAK